MKNADFIRGKIRDKLKIQEDEFVILHAGKLSKDKKTEQLLYSFKRIKNNKIRLILVGSADHCLITKIEKFTSNDHRINYHGWLQSSELRELFFGCDLLVQPGSLSNIFISAICCGLPILVAESPQGRAITLHGNGGIIPKERINQLDEVIIEFLEVLKQREMKESAISMAEYYGYRNIATLSLQ